MENKNYIEHLKVCLKDKNIEESADCLLKLFEQDEKNFKRSLMLSGVLPEPLSFDLDKNIYKFEVFKEACILVIKQVKERKGKNLDDFIKQVAIIINGYEVLKNSNISNENRCNRNEFVNYNKARQLQMWCVFIQDQMRLSEDSINHTMKNNGVFTGTESMTPLKIDANEIYNLSSSDSIENKMELAEEIFGFIFYINRKSIKDYVDMSCIDSYPYELPSFEEIAYLTSHRVMLKRTWGLFKYENWTLTVNKSNDNIKYCFVPQDYDKFKKESTAIKRAEYNAFQKSIKAVWILQAFDDNLKYVMQQTSKVSLSDIFNIDEKYLKKLMAFYAKVIKSQMDFALEFYGENLWKVNVQESIDIKTLFSTINYLYSIASIYMSKSYEEINFDDKKDYYKLAPIINKSKLARQLSKALDISEEIALRCIDIFTFKPIFEKKQIALDIFSQPLIYVSEEQIIFTPCFILQMNAERIIDKILGAIDYNLADKGFKMESIVNNLIDENKYISVNRNKIKFNAFDGKDVEFDCIAVFEGKLIIMEMKCRTAPYSEKEKNDKEAVLYEAIEQVKRRVQVVQNNWEEIKKRSSIKLMDIPPKESDIIKIVCFNFFTFTGQVVDNVYVTDHSAITKYFDKPIDYANVGSENGIKKMPVRNIWNGDRPTLNNFLEFLQMPSMVKNFYDNIKFIYRPIICIEEDDESLFVADYFLEKNPYEEYIDLAVKKNEKNTNEINKENDNTKIKSKLKKNIKKNKNRIKKASRKRNCKKK